MQRFDSSVSVAASHADLWELYEQTRSIDMRNKLIVEYSSLVKKIALKMVGNYQYFSHLDDLVNEGIIALMDAVEKFDAKKNTKFETFASIKIKGAIIDYIRKQDCFPRRIKRMARVLAEAEGELSNSLGRSPTQQELADKVGLTADQLSKAQLEVYALNVYSFEQIVFETNTETVLMSAFSSTSASPEQCLANQEAYQKLAEAIEGLKGNEKTVIALHYKEQLKIKDIAEILKISDSRVSQIHSNALRKLKKALLDYNEQ